jgi:Mg2+ and Co2+ transporter CorA
MSNNTVAPMNLAPRIDGNFMTCDVNICNDFSKVVADKLESQEKEIDYLKKNALAQEIKINELSKLVDQLIVVFKSRYEHATLIKLLAKEKEIKEKERKAKEEYWRLQAEVQEKLKAARDPHKGAGGRVDDLFSFVVK